MNRPNILQRAARGQDSARRIVAWTIFAVMAAPLTIYSGFAISWAWEWFVVPIGVPSISIPQAAGLALFPGTFLAAVSRVYSDEAMEDRLISMVGYSLVTSTLLLTLGFVLSRFM